MVLTLARLPLCCAAVFCEDLVCRSESWKFLLTLGRISLRESRALSLEVKVVSVCRVPKWSAPLFPTYMARRELAYTVKGD